MAIADLRKPFLDDGIRTTNFFNGRVLFGEDLRREQEANQALRELLGEAVGEGVAFGLEVSGTLGGASKTAPTVMIEPGLGFNRRGHALALTQRIELRISAPPDDATSTSGSARGDFDACAALPAGVDIAGKGVYLLVMSPAEGREGRAQVSGLGNVDANCNAKALVDGVRFCLVRLDPPLLANTDLAASAEPRLRNVAAYKCFGYGAADPKSPLQRFAEDPFGSLPAPLTYGVVDALRGVSIDDSHLPLALIYWVTGYGTKFVDNWSVRRRPTQVKQLERWPIVAGDRRVAEAEAMFRQFEDQIFDLRSAERDTLDTISGPERFRFLPPAGVIPVKATKSPRGFDPQKLFGGLAPGVETADDIETIDAAALRALLAEAPYHEPIDLDRADTPAAPNKIQLYRIWENIQAVARGDVDQLAVVFANQTLPYRGVARFGYAHWKRSRFAPRVL